MGPHKLFWPNGILKKFFSMYWYVKIDPNCGPTLESCFAILPKDAFTQTTIFLTYLSIKITFNIPGIESFPSSRATIPFTLVIHVWSLDLDMLVIDMIDKVIHAQKLAVTMNPATLVELHSGRGIFLLVGVQSQVGKSTCRWSTAGLWILTEIIYI